METTENESESPERSSFLHPTNKKAKVKPVPKGSPEKVGEVGRVSQERPPQTVKQKMKVFEDPRKCPDELGKDEPESQGRKSFFHTVTEKMKVFQAPKSDPEEFNKDESNPQESTPFLNTANEETKIYDVPESCSDEQGGEEQLVYENTSSNFYENMKEPALADSDLQNEPFDEHYITMGGVTAAQKSSARTETELQETTFAQEEVNTDKTLVDNMSERPPIGCVQELDYETPRQTAKFNTARFDQDVNLLSGLNHIEVERSASKGDVMSDFSARDQFTSRPETNLLPKRVTRGIVKKVCTQKALVVCVVVNVVLVIVTFAVMIAVFTVHLKNNSHENGNDETRVADLDKEVQYLQHLVSSLCLKLNCSTDVPIETSTNGDKTITFNITDF